MRDVKTLRDFLTGHFFPLAKSPAGTGPAGKNCYITILATSTKIRMAKPAAIKINPIVALSIDKPPQIGYIVRAGGQAPALNPYRFTRSRMMKANPVSVARSATIFNTNRAISNPLIILPPCGLPRRYSYISNISQGLHIVNTF
jgi:hypothetical protein